METLFVFVRYLQNPVYIIRCLELNLISLLMYINRFTNELNYAGMFNVYLSILPTLKI